MTAEPLIGIDTLIDISGEQLDDDEITRQKLDAVSQQIRNYCGWHIGPERTEQVTVDGPGGFVLALPTLHLIDIEQITDAGTTIDDPEWSRTGDVRKPDGRPWSTRFRGITATITHGYDQVPALAELILELVAQAVNTPAGTTAVGEKMGPFSFDGAAAATGARYAIGGATLLSSQLAVLDHYRIQEPA